VSKINAKALLAPVLTMAMFALVPVSASATVACRVLTFGTSSQEQKATCNNPPGVTAPQNLRENGDGSGTTPVSTNFPTSALAVNTAGALRYLEEEGYERVNTFPLGDVVFGVKLEHDPESSTTACRAATGSIPWFDASNGAQSAFVAGTGAWTFSIDEYSTACEKNKDAGKVTIGNVALLFETLGIRGNKRPQILTGTLEGRYLPPGSKVDETNEVCPAGGIELDEIQKGLNSEPAQEKVKFDNGTRGATALFCFVAANNYLFPSTAPTWAPFRNINGTEKVGIWKD
jgi:hypothetical protein